VGSVTWAAVRFLGAVLLFVLNCLFVPLLQKDLEEGMPWFAAWLVRRAVQRLPVEHQERFEEEWLAELTAIPGVMIFKLRFALGVSLRARSASRAMQGRPPWWEETLRRLAQPLTEAFSFRVEAIQRVDRGRSRHRSTVDRLAHWSRMLLAVTLGIVIGESILLKIFDTEIQSAIAGTKTEDTYESGASNSAGEKQAELKFRTLGPREREILGLLANGWSNRRIAEECFLSLNTVRTHVQNVLVKLGVHSKLEAVAFALEHQLIDIQPDGPARSAAPDG
jgi:DNA-binding CsgD family transcriptional regulator